ncbi:MAG: translation initiation factor [Candidatus Omnitrophica bacterium]|nr:translation initiation factor [Candidatus Omnitrophota bacterium]
MIDIPDFVYPKDSKGKALCPRCKKLVAQCDCPFFEGAKPKSQLIKPSIRLDKSGRRGKVVTLIGALPHSEEYLKNLAKELKVKTGTGGTFYLAEDGGVVELQGDHKEVVAQYFRKNNN